MFAKRGIRTKEFNHGDSSNRGTVSHKHTSHLVPTKIDRLSGRVEWGDELCSIFC